MIETEVCKTRTRFTQSEVPLIEKHVALVASLAALFASGCIARADDTSTDVLDDSSRGTLDVGADVDHAMPDLAPLDENPDGSAKTNLTVALLVNDDASSSPDPLVRTRALLKSLDLLFSSIDGLKLTRVEPAVDMTTYTLASGRIISDDTMRAFAAIGAGDVPAGLSAEDALDLDAQVGARAAGHFLTFDGTTTRAHADGAARKVAFEALVYFGAGRDPAPFKYALRRADVVLYDGPSFIGAGPLDPSRYAADDYSSSNQIVFTSGCVSYTQYQSEFLDRKSGFASGTMSLVALGHVPGDAADAAFSRALALIVGDNVVDHSIDEARTYAARRTLAGIASNASPLRIRTPDIGTPDIGASQSSDTSPGSGASAALVTSPK